MATSSGSYMQYKSLLLSYCKKIASEIQAQKEQAQDNNQKEIILTIYHDKCSNLIDEVTSFDGEALSFVVLSNVLQKIAQLVLDFTYVEECCLVDHDFLLQGAYERVSYIIEALSSVESLAVEAAPDNHPHDVLGPTLAECLHWRKGALFYMYCHTVNARCLRDQLPPHFKQCLENGSKHLVDMLSTRSSPLWLKDAAVLQQEKTSAGASGDEGDMLLSQGIYSDTHLLALMYLGEMCYWYAQLVQPVSQDSPAKTCQSDIGVPVDGGKDVCDTHLTDTNLGKQSMGEPALAEARSDVAMAGAGGAVIESHSVTHPDPGCDGRASLQSGLSMDMLKIGQLCLENYVQAVKGPMSAGGWSTDRAEEILQFFENLTL
ncbi:upf0600 protein c5orf51 [Plakobranchus ocellatus]|uniref:Upf0600 protein c5orf51 n=1 Tax=Plakobranchus ocellatus TaxID=259542 RepID=A0AAV4BSF5_9GAST|nr:upf0600 protein c5orf51 [Plakobranchus ocellatus]